MVDAIDYFFEFPDKGTAQRDLVVGPFMASQATLEPIIYQANIDSVDALLDYYVIVRQVGALNSAFVNNVNIFLINDVTLRNEMLPSVVLTTVMPVSGLAIIINAFSPYANINTLQLAPGATVLNPYITEADDPYVTEDGLSIYVVEP